MPSKGVDLSSIDEVGGEPVEGKSSADESPALDSDSVHAAHQSNEVSDDTPELKVNGESESVSVSAPVRFHVIASNLRKNLWREATDLTNPDWPPNWLKALGALWILWLGVLIIWLAIVVMSVLIKILAALGLTISVLLSETKWTQLVLRPVRNYLDIHSTSLSFSPGQIFGFWVLSGLILFVLSTRGSIGGRIGWAVFGIGTAAMVWNETSEPSKWLATGFTAVLWSLLCTLAYRRIEETSSTFTNRIRFPEFLATIERRAEQNARLLAYIDLADYLDNKVNQPRDVISTDLKIPRERLPALLRRRFPQGVPGRSKLSPKDRREIAHAVLVEGKSRAEVAGHYDISQSTVSEVIKKHGTGT